MSSFFRPLKKPSISVLLGQFSLIAALLIGGLLSFMLMQTFMMLFNEQQDKHIKNDISKCYVNFEGRPQDTSKWGEVINSSVKIMMAKMILIDFISLVV